MTRSRLLPTVAGALALAVLAAALMAFVTLQLSNRHAVDQARDGSVAAATAGVATVLSYDYRHLDSDFAKADTLLTSSFRKKYDSTTGSAVKPLAAQAKAVSTASVDAAGVVTASADRAVVLVFVSQTVTNAQLAAPRLDRSRVDVTLVRAGGRWLIDNLQPV